MREALEILAPTDAVLFKFQALLDLAEVYRLAGREAAARDALEEAAELARLKGSVVLAHKAQRLMEALGERTLV